MGYAHDYQAIQGTPGKGVYSGCDVTRTDADTVAMSAGQVRFGLTSDDIGADKVYHNKLGTQKAVSAVASFDIVVGTALGVHTIYLKTDGTLALTPETPLSVTAGPVGLVGTNLNAMTFDTPSIALCTFEKTAALGTAASGTVTIGGTIVAGEEFRVFLNGVEYAYTSTNADVAGDATADRAAIAEGLKLLIDASSLYVATRSAAIVTVTYKDTTVAGNDVTLTVSTDSASGTIVAGAATLAGAVLGGIKEHSISYERRETLV